MVFCHPAAIATFRHLPRIPRPVAHLSWPKLPLQLRPTIPRVFVTPDGGHGCPMMGEDSLSVCANASQAYGNWNQRNQERPSIKLLIATSSKNATACEENAHSQPAETRFVATGQVSKSNGYSSKPISYSPWSEGASHSWRNDAIRAKLRPQEGLRPETDILIG